MKLLDPEDGAAKEAVEPVFASVAAVADVAGTRDNAFEENESDREPRKSTSTLLEVVEAAERFTRTELSKCYLPRNKHHNIDTTSSNTININLKSEMIGNNNDNKSFMPLVSQLLQTKVRYDSNVLS